MDGTFVTVPFRTDLGRLSFSFARTPPASIIMNVGKHQPTIEEVQLGLLCLTLALGGIDRTTNKYPI